MEIDRKCPVPAEAHWCEICLECLGDPLDKCQKGDEDHLGNIKRAFETRCARHELRSITLISISRKFPLSFGAYFTPCPQIGIFLFTRKKYVKRLKRTYQPLRKEESR
jgi:hypothetical protein